MPHSCPTHPKRPDLKCPRCRATLPRAGAKAAVPAQLAPQPTPRAAARQPCRYEGAVLEFCTKCGTAGELGHVRDCDKFERATRGPNSKGVASCQTCKDYAPPLLQLGEPLTPSAGVGVVLGCYGFPKLTALQVATIRRTCGPVPVLIADDGSGRDAEFEAIAADYPDVTFWPSEHRLGHYAGDLSVFSKGLQFAHNRGLRWLCKLSQRFVWTEPGWLASAVAMVEGTGHKTLMQRCMDSARGKPVDLKVRSESMVLDVPAWVPFVPEMQRGKLNNPTEYFIWHIVHREWGGRFAEWKGLTVNRYARTPGTIWHGSHNRAAYERWAKGMGMPLDESFYTEGHQGKPGWVKG